MPDAGTFDAIAKLGGGALFAIAVFAFYTRRVRTAGEATEDKSEADARLAEMRIDRDRWRSIAEAYGDKLDELTRTLEVIAAFGTKLDRLLELVEKGIRGTDRLREIVEKGFAKVAGP